VLRSSGLLVYQDEANVDVKTYKVAFAAPKPFPPLPARLPYIHLCLSHLIQSASRMVQPTKKTMSPEEIVPILCQIHKANPGNSKSPDMKTFELSVTVFKELCERFPFQANMFV
jgi:hypothetical protein